LTSELEAWAIGVACIVFKIALLVIGLILLWRIAAILIRAVRRRRT